MANGSPAAHGYDVLWPLGRTITTPIPEHPRLGRLDDIRVGFIWDYMFRGDELFDVLRGELKHRHRGLDVVDYPEFGNIHGPNERKVLAELPEKLRASKVDAVVVGVGA